MLGYTEFTLDELIQDVHITVGVIPREPHIFLNFIVLLKCPKMVHLMFGFLHTLIQMPWSSSSLRNVAFTNYLPLSVRTDSGLLTLPNVAIYGSEVRGDGLARLGVYRHRGSVLGKDVDGMNLVAVPVVVLRTRVFMCARCSSQGSPKLFTV